MRRAVTVRSDHDERGRVFLGGPAQAFRSQPFLHAADDVEAMDALHHISHKSVCRRGGLFARCPGRLALDSATRE